jgi:hypothetical protein
MTEQTTGRTESLPPQYYQDLMKGIPGANVPGIMPLLNQNLVNQLQSLGVPGGTPYTYQGQRIADFTPAERQAMRMTGENVGSYQPYFDEASQMARQGYGDARGSATEGQDYMRQGVQQGVAGIGEAQNLLRQVPGVARDATFEGLGGIRTGQSTLGQAGDILGGAAQGFDPKGISSFMNPYEDAVVGRALQDLEEQGAKADIAGRAQAIGSGAFGGSRARLGAQEREEALRKAQLETAGNLRAQGYESSANRAQSAFESQQARQLNQANAMANLGQGQAGMGSQIAGLGQNLSGTIGTAAGGLGSLGTGLSNIYGGTGQNLASSGLQVGQFGSNVGGQMAGLGQGLSGLRQGDIGNMMNIGGMQRGQNQAGLDLAYQNFVGQYNLPTQLIGQTAGIAQGLAPTLGGTTLAQGSTSGGNNNMMSNLGTAIAGYGMYKDITNPGVQANTVS